MDSLLQNAQIKEALKRNRQRNDLVPSRFGSVNLQTASNLHSLTSSLNAKSASSLGPRDINSLTDSEYSRLFSTLERVLRM
jgi:hypothetical protein